MSEKRIAIVVPAINLGGGVPAMARSLRHILSRSGRYQGDLISLSTSSSDEASVRGLSPSSWLQGPRIVDGTHRGLPYRHVGAKVTELEFQRYRPRRLLTELLNDYDLVQVVAGTPAWAAVARNVRRPVVLWVATLAKLERGSVLAKASGVTGLVRRSMAAITYGLDARAPRYAAHTFTLNRMLRDRIRERSAPSKVSVALPGLDIERFRPEAERSEDFILSVARFDDPRKNLPMLLTAYQLLRRQVPSAPRLLIASANHPLPAEWSLVDSLGLTDHVELRVGLNSEELAPFYRNASMFVLASNEEGLGIVILEAMASGAPVVSTDCGGPSEVVVEGETGFLTPVGDAASFASRMAQILESRALRHSMGAAGRRVAEDRFSVEAAGRVFVEKYDELLEAVPTNSGVEVLH